MRLESLKASMKASQLSSSRLSSLSAVQLEKLDKALEKVRASLQRLNK